MPWDSEYDKHKRVWGEGPSELARAAVDYLKKNRFGEEPFRILDVGCGYGRDAFYMTDNLRCRILGIDISEKGIEIASRTAREKNVSNLEFRCIDLAELDPAGYDIVVASNLYQILKPDGREYLRRAVARSLRPEGLLFLSTLSVNDPEHQGKGVPVPGEPDSIQEKGKYIHLCTKEELTGDFGYLSIKELYEHEYDEPRATGETHHHVSWILVAEMQQHSTTVE